MKYLTSLCLLAALHPLAAAPIIFESPDYATATPLSTGTGTLTDRLFNGQQAWSQSTSSHAGQVIVTTTSGSYTGGQGLTANTTTGTTQTYIGAKAGVLLTNYSFDFRYQSLELGIGGWNDDDADGKFDQTEAEYMPGIVAVTGGTAFGLRVAGFGATGGPSNTGRFSTGTAGVNGNWYRMSVTPDFANLQVTLAVHDLTNNAAVPLTTSTFTLTSTEFGGDPAAYDGLTARVSSNSGGITLLDNISPDGSPPDPPAPLPGGASLVAANGAWTWFNDNQAIVLPNGRHLVGYVKSDGNIAANSFDPATATGSEIILSGAGAVQADDHNNPSFTQLGNGNIFTAYSRHDPDSFWFRRTSTTADPRLIADFSAQSQGPTMPRGNSYSNAFRLSTESRIYHFSRSINYNPTLTTSTDEGQTWSTPVQLIRTGTGGNRPYVRYSSNHLDRIDAIYTDDHPRDIENSLYHLTISGGSVRRSDGSLIRSTSLLPVLHDAPDLERGSPIYTYSAAAWGVGQGPNDWIPLGRAWSWDIHRGSGDQPVAVFTVRVANVTGTGWNHNRIYYYYARWDGSQWKKTFIAHAGRPLYSAEADYAGGICIDPADPRVVYISTNAASPFALGSLTSVPLAAGDRYEIYRGFTADGGLTFNWEPVTNLTIHDNHIEETGNLRPDFGGYAMKAQDRNFSVSAANVLEGLKVYNNTLIVPSHGAWENGMAPAISAEFLGMALKDCEIYNNTLNNHISLAGSASLGRGIHIHNNFFNLGWGRYGYGVEAMMDNLEIDHNHFFGGIYPIALWGKHPKNHNIHHNLFEGACAGGFVNRELLQYMAPVTNLRFINNTIIDNGGIGRIFALHTSSTYEARNNLIIRTLEPKDIWGTKIPGKVFHNFFANTTPHGENAMTGDPGITLAEGRPLRPPYYTAKPDSSILNNGEILSPWTDGFTGTAPDMGAIENGVPFTIPFQAHETN